MKKAVVFAYFGSQNPQAEDGLKVLIDKASLPAGYQKETLRLLHGKEEETALKEKLQKDGVEEVLFSALILEDGATYQRLKEIQMQWKSSFSLVKVTKPLFQKMEDAAVLQEALGEKPLLLVFHGRTNSLSLMAESINQSSSTLRACTLQGEPSLEESLKNIREESLEVYPMLLTNGHHMTKDILGDEEDALFPRLRKLGYEPYQSEKYLVEEPFLLPLLQQRLEEEL